MDLLLKVIETEHCQTFKMERFAKRIMPDCRRATRNFSGQGSFVETFSSKTQEKLAPQGSILKFFLVDTLQTTF